MKKYVLSLIGLVAVLLAGSASALEYKFEFDGQALEEDIVFSTGQRIGAFDSFTFAFTAKDFGPDDAGEYYIAHGSAYFESNGTVIPVSFSFDFYLPELQVGNYGGYDWIGTSYLQIKELPDHMKINVELSSSAFDSVELDEVVGTYPEHLFLDYDWFLDSSFGVEPEDDIASMHEVRISRADWNFIAMDYGDGVNVHVLDIAPDGSAVTGEVWGSDLDGYQAFVWTMEEGMTLIGGISGTAVSCDGEYVAGVIKSEDGVREEAGIWHRETGWRPLGGRYPSFDVPDYIVRLSEPTDMSCDGQVVVGEAYPCDLEGCSATRAVYWPAGQPMVKLLEYDFDPSSAESVSADGSVAWGFEEGWLIEWSLPGLEAQFLWNSNDLQSTVMSPNGEWRAHGIRPAQFAINDPTNVVANAAFVVPGASSETLPLVEGIDDRGNYFVGQLRNTEPGPWDRRAVIYDFFYNLVPMEVFLRDKGVDLSVVGPLWQAMGISGDGQTITGTALRTDGTHGVSWVATTDTRTPPAGYTIWTPPPCELDWNCDGVVNFSDLYDTTNGGMYQDWRLYDAYHDHPVYGPYVEGGYYHKRHCGQPGILDWDGNGLIEYRDVYGGTPSGANLDTFYTQLWVYQNYPGYYDHYYPDSFCE